MKYYVAHVDDSSDKLDVFDTIEEIEAFLDTLKDDEEGGCWIKYVFYGELLEVRTKKTVHKVGEK
jgi:hypothetical protein